MMGQNRFDALGATSSKHAPRDREPTWRGGECSPREMNFAAILTVGRHGVRGSRLRSYGGIYIAASRMWRWAVEPQTADLLGAVADDVRCARPVSARRPAGIGSMRPRAGSMAIRHRQLNTSYLVSRYDPAPPSELKAGLAAISRSGSHRTSMSFRYR
jgi:hypothetical protein